MNAPRCRSCGATTRWACTSKGLGRFHTVPETQRENAARRAGFYEDVRVLVREARR